MKRIVSGSLGLALLFVLGGCAAAPPEQAQPRRSGPSPAPSRAIGGTADSGGATIVLSSTWPELTVWGSETRREL